MDTFFNQVNDWLLVGADLDVARDTIGFTDGEAITCLMNRGVTHVLDARIEWTDALVWQGYGLPPENYAHLPIVDSHSHQPAEAWFQGVEDFVQDFLANRDEGDKLYVHCHMGVNRGPSAAMLALLTADPDLSPWDAFLAIREARSIAGLVYAEYVGARHISRKGGTDYDMYLALGDFRRQMRDYWSPARVESVNRGIAFYRSKEGGTLVV